MPDTAPTTGSSTGVEGGASGGQSGLTQALVAAIAAAVQTGVSQAMTEATQQIAKQVAESISAATDSDSGYVIRSSLDPAAGQRRLENYAEMALADCIAFRKAIDAEIVCKVSVDTDHHQPHPASSAANPA